MRRRPVLLRSDLSESFDLTPIIDVVFLLMIFFILVCQFISAESYEVAVPDEIATARQPEEAEGMTTVTVMRGADGEVTLAVGAETLSPSGPDAARLLASAIDERLERMGQGDRRVCLRCEKSIPFEYTRVVLEGISQSGAEDVQWAVLGKQ